MKRTGWILAGCLLGMTQLSYSQFAEVQVSTGSEESRIDLNGTWFFKPVFSKNDPGKKAVDSTWKGIQVPGEWRMQGFKVEPGGQASYFREFFVPAKWKNKVVYLRCDAVFSEAHIWVNGRDAGTHIGPMVAFEREVTDLLNYGEKNRIVLGIIAETLADTLMSGTQYAAHQLGGILRKIYLHAVPTVHLTDLAIQTRFDEHYENADLSLSGLVKNYGLSGTASISVSLADPEGNVVSLDNDSLAIIFRGLKEKWISHSINISKPLKWDAEHPNLYTLKMTVKSEEGMEIIERNVGFRQIEVAGNQVFVNGRAIKLKGVNRHEAHPLLGRSLNDELWERDARMYKQANVNYIRTSHYPPAEEFIEWCDRLGMYVELENPVSWIGHHANAHWKNHDPHDPELYPYLEEISAANMAFFGRHPSIIMWSMANESAWGDNWQKLADFYREKDPTRPATFHDQAYGGFNNYGSTTMPVANIHYPGPGGPEVAEDFSRPLLFGEYAHLNTYNRSEIVTDPGVRDSWGRGFSRMWENMYKSRGCLGGAIWSGIDDVFYLPEGQAVGYGEWGPIDGWRREKPEYFHIRKAYSPVKIHGAIVQVPEPGKSINLQVENRFDFTNLSECDIVWQLPDERGSIPVDLPPHQSGIIKIFPQTSPQEGQKMGITVTSPQGVEVESCMIEIGHADQVMYPFNSIASGSLVVEEREHTIEIAAREFSWKFDSKEGKLVHAQVAGNKVLDDGAELMVLSLTTGECLTEHSLDIPFHNSSCSGWKAERVSWDQTNDTVRITVQGGYVEAEGVITYLFAGDGLLKVNYTMKSKIDIDPRQWGMVFAVPQSLKILAWERKGLWSHYPENHIGRTSGTAVPFQSRAVPGAGDVLVSKVGKEWRFDANELGTNDFRATRENIYWATLTRDNGSGIAVVSNGMQAFRSFVDGDRIRFLVADYCTGGGEAFFSRYYADERTNIRKGDQIHGSASIRLIEGVETR